MRFRKKPIIINAIQFKGTLESYLEIIKELTIQDANEFILTNNGSKIIVHTLEGNMIADSGDWIIRGIRGEAYPCKPDIFEATYEAVQC